MQLGELGFTQREIHQSVKWQLIKTSRMLRCMTQADDVCTACAIQHPSIVVLVVKGFKEHSFFSKILSTVELSCLQTSIIKYSPSEKLSSCVHDRVYISRQEMTRPHQQSFNIVHFKSIQSVTALYTVACSAVQCVVAALRSLSVVLALFVTWSHAFDQRLLFKFRSELYSFLLRLIVQNVILRNPF